MTTAAIPPWNAVGVLPPVHDGRPVAPERSPYRVSLTDFLLHFGQTPERRAVMEGFLRHRAALHALGLTRGFQWLDGSFLEHVEQIERRPPADIDVVTFFHFPAGASKIAVLAGAPDVFKSRAAKARYSVDAYFVDLGMASERLVRQSAYWYSMFSHRRNLTWKGMVEVDLDPALDAAAATALATLVAGSSVP